MPRKSDAGLTPSLCPGELFHQASIAATTKNSGRGATGVLDF
jgi:hypothetical protein